MLVWMMLNGALPNVITRASLVRLSAWPSVLIALSPVSAPWHVGGGHSARAAGARWPGAAQAGAPSCLSAADDAIAQRVRSGS